LDTTVNCSGSVKDKLNLALTVLNDNGIVEDLEPDELVQISNEIGYDYKQYPKVAKTITYIRKRTLDKETMVEAFKYSFPERCIATEDSKRGNFIPQDREPTPLGSELPKKTIEFKAKRLENSRLYKAITTILNTSLYTIFALERIEVLHQALSKINSDKVSDRNKAEYMKLFLQETRKPEKAQELEVNVNLQQNNISIEHINRNLSDIASKLENSSAGSIINLLESKE